MLQQYINLIVFNAIIYLLAFNLAVSFLKGTLFSDQEIKYKLNLYIFSATFGLCVLMLVLFLQDALETHDNTTSYFIWKVMFFLMDIDLFLVIPLALIWDIFVKNQ